MDKQQDYFETGDLVQLTPDAEGAFGECFMTVLKQQDDVVSGYMLIPRIASNQQDKEFCMLHVGREQVAKVGTTLFVPENLEEMVNDVPDIGTLNAVRHPKKDLMN